MKKTRKRFQTGREIMRTYVPNYVPPTQPDEDPQRLGMRSGDDVAQALLREFTRQLSKKKLRLKRHPAASTKASKTNGATRRR